MVPNVFHPSHHAGLACNLLAVKVPRFMKQRVAATSEKVVVGTREVQGNAEQRNPEGHGTGEGQANEKLLVRGVK